MTTPNPLDPDFWRAQGIEPIEVDPNNPESVEKAVNEVFQRILDIASETEPQPQKKKPSE
jgi:hypothetical protein